MKEELSIGLDVGNSHINMVELARGAEEKIKLLGYSSVDLNPGRGKEEKLKQLEAVVEEKKIVGSTVNIAVAGESVIVRYIYLPRMRNEEVGKALRYEAQQYIPFRMEEVIFDYHILEPLNSKRNKIRVLLVAAKKQAITESIEFIQEAGLKPNLIDVDSFCLINCFQLNGPRLKENAVFALVNLELDLVNINILEGEFPYFTRDISLAEEGLSLDPEKDKEEELFETMRPLLANLIREIRLSIDYYESEFEKQVGIIYLSGRGAGIPELTRFFSSQLGREVKRWDPLQNILVDSALVDIDTLKDASSRLALVCGLALR